MNKRALLNAVVRNVMTKIAAQQAKDSSAAIQKSIKDLQAPGGIISSLRNHYGRGPSIVRQQFATPELIGYMQQLQAGKKLPKLSEGQINNLTQKTYSYRIPDHRLQPNQMLIGRTIDYWNDKGPAPTQAQVRNNMEKIPQVLGLRGEGPYTRVPLYSGNARQDIRKGIADRVASIMYPSQRVADHKYSKIDYPRYKRLRDAAINFGKYRENYHNDKKSLDGSLEFSQWTQDNAPDVYKDLLTADPNRKSMAEQLMNWQVNNRRNSGNGYV